MADHSRHDRADFDVLVSGGTRREVKKAAKKRYPGVKLKVQVKKTPSKGRIKLASVSLKDKKGEPVVRRGKVPKVIVSVKKGKIKSFPSF